MKIKSLLSVLLAAVLALGAAALPAAAEETIDVSTLYKNKDVDDAWSASEAQAINLDAVQGGVVNITEKGDYVLSGTLNGQIVVETPEDEKVRLILNGVTITASRGPAIYEKQADKLVITLAEGTVNTLTDGETVTDDDDTIGAALYAEDDLSVNGSGSLIINGTRKHGIQSKADLIIAGGSITVNAALDGIRGRNSVLVLDGAISVTAGGDGIVSTRTDAEDKGWVVLAGGNVTVRTGDGAGEVRVSANGRGGAGGRGRWDDWGSVTGAADNGVSQKAVKAAAGLTVLGGSYTFDCADDGLHAVNVTVNGGTFSIKSGDDGMHADKEMTVNAGTIDIARCYEGLEGENVTVNGGSIRIVSSDDGINASGGGDGSGFGGWGRGGGFTGMGSSGMLTITGGQIGVTAGGDGLDSNGSILVSGGVTGVWTASSGMEGPIDFNGSGTITGGTLIVATSGGYGRNAAGLSGLKTVSVSASGQAGETITLTDGKGTVLGTFTPESAFSTLMISSSALEDGGNFSVLSGSRTLYSGAMADSVTSATSEARGGDPYNNGADPFNNGGQPFNNGGGRGPGRGHGRGGH